LSGPGHTKRRYWAVSAVLALAVTAIGVNGARQAAAQFENPAHLLELLKKKKAKEEAEKKKKGLPNLFTGKKQDGKKTAVTPNNAPGKNVTGKGTDTKGPASAALPNSVDRKGIAPQTGTPQTGIGKGVDSKSAKATIGNVRDGKGTSPKSVLGTADGKGTNAKTALSKATDSKGTNTRTLLGKAGDAKGPPGATARTAFTGPLRGATPVERLRLRADHRREILNVRRLLPTRLLPGQPGFTGVPPVGETRFISTEMVFRAGPTTSRQAVEDTARRYGLTVIGSQDAGLAGGTLYHFRVAGGRAVPDVIRALETENLGVASANYVYRLFQEDPDLAAQSEGGASEQYVVNKLGLAEVHKIATGNNVLVAVIDSAIDASHPDVAGAIVETYDAVGRREPPHFHGTGMAGAIAAHQRLVGIAPGVRILAVQAFSGTTRQSPEATTRQILAGLEWAIRKGARVVNMSFAGPYDPMLQLAMKNAAAKGVVLIAAAGNLGPKSPPLYPAADPHVIAVTATDENDKLFPGAVRGPHLAVAAPGVDVMVPAPEETYQLTTGTSVAAAHVSGVAALLIERHPSVDSATVLEVLTSTAKKLSPKGHDDQFGWGLIDPASALAELDSRMADSKVASAARPATPKQSTAKPATQKQAAPKLSPASAQ